MPTVNVFYLGTMSDLDPDETNTTSENAHDLVGLTVGSSGAPLYQNIDALTLLDSDSDGVILENDSGATAENISYAGTGAALDGVIEVDVTLTYTDGSTAITQMFAVQDVLGRVFLMPHPEGDARNDVLDDHPIVSIHIDAAENNAFIGVYADAEQDVFITCFAAGTLIATKQGVVDITRLSVGDKVCTMDHGYQPIRWIGGRRVRAVGEFAPIRINVGALGQGLPTRALLVSPQHRILVRSKIAQRVFGMSEVLLSAKKMLGMPGISVANDFKHVTYWHFLFDQHEIVFSEGAATESFYTGPEAMKGLDQDVRNEIHALFPELAHKQGLPNPAKPIARGKQLNQLIARHQKNSRLFFQDCTT